MINKREKMPSGHLRVAVVSDLHFVSTDNIKDGTYHSWLTFDSDGSFNNSFWQSLLDKVESNNIQADILICPGDITTHAESRALKFAWSKLIELAKALGCNLLATATGNHDVSSRNKPLENVVRGLDADTSLVGTLKGLTPPYPLVDFDKNDDDLAHSDRISYFGSDFLLKDDADDYRLVVLNSCGSHSADPLDYERGNISDPAINWLERALCQVKASTNKKLGILVCHHHPILHPEHNLGSYDFMRGGSKLLEMLNNHGHWVVIHGHKHHAKLTYHAVGSKKTVVFAAGTLSAHKSTLNDEFANQFYIVDIDCTKKRGTPEGKLEVYSWQANGWSLSKRTKDGVFTGVGFGDVGCLEELAENIAKIVTSVTSTSWEEIVSQFPKLEHCVPLDLKHLESYLQEHNVDINRNDDSEIESLERSM